MYIELNSEQMRSKKVTVSLTNGETLVNLDYSDSKDNGFVLVKGNDIICIPMTSIICATFHDDKTQPQSN